MAVPEAMVTHLPDGVDPINAAAIPLVSSTGDQPVRNATRAPAGQTILVSGARGSVGRAVVQPAKKPGAKDVVEVHARRLKQAGTPGARSAVALDDDGVLSRPEAGSCGRRG